MNNVQYIVNPTVTSSSSELTMADPGDSGGPENNKTAYKGQRQGSDAAEVGQARGGEGTMKNMIIIMTKHSYAKATGNFYLHPEIIEVARTLLTHHKVQIYGRLGAPDLRSPQDLPKDEKEIENWFQVRYNANKGTHFIKFFMESEPIEKMRQEGLRDFAKRKNILIKEDTGFQKPTRKNTREINLKETTTTTDRPPESHKSYAAAVGGTIRHPYRAQQTRFKTA